MTPATSHLPSKPRIVLTPLRADDSDSLYQWINDRTLVLLNAPYRPVSEEDHREWFRAVQKRSDQVIFAIRLADSNALIGTCQLHSIHPVHRSAELQIRIGDAQHRSRGYGTEAVRLLVRFAFDDLNLNRVFLHVLATNDVARRVYEKAGFAQEGLMREAAHVDGRYVDVLVMAILRGDPFP